MYARPPRCPRRFTELRVPLGRVTPKVLTETLRAMERDGLVDRCVHDGPRPHVTYALTGLGRSFVELLDAVTDWCLAHGDEVAEARAAYEGRAPS